MRQLFVAAAISVAMIAVALVIGLSAGGGSERSPRAPAQKEAPDRGSGAAATPRPERYNPDRAEEFPKAKRVASRVAEEALTYEPGASAREVARSLPRSGQSRAELARVLEPAVDSAMRSVGTVVYPQLSGLTESTLGAMVIARQLLQAPDGESETITRVLDIRLQLKAGDWTLEGVASVGGSPVDRPGSLPAAARRLLDHPRIMLTDSARWDIYRGVIDTSLLQALTKAARKHAFSVGILKSGHPENVWATNRPSAHTQGFAVDIYAVDEQPVIGQRGTESPAYDLAKRLYARGAAQLGSPWDLDNGGARSFTDPVHQDHLHLQQSPVS